jgi:hypothetical protein
MLDRPALLRAVQIDDVDATGARRDEARQPRGGLVVIDGLLVEPAVHQAHANAVSQVDGGINDHAGSSRKFLRIRAPASAERSG